MHLELLPRHHTPARISFIRVHLGLGSKAPTFTKTFPKRRPRRQFKDSGLAPRFATGSPLASLG